MPSHFSSFAFGSVWRAKGLSLFVYDVMSMFVCRLPNSGPAAFLGSMPSDVWWDVGCVPLGWQNCWQKGWCYWHESYLLLSHFEVLLQETDVPLHIMDTEPSQLQDLPHNVRCAIPCPISCNPLYSCSFTPLAPQAIQDLLASPQAALGEGTEKRREVGTYFITLYTILSI